LIWFFIAFYFSLSFLLLCCPCFFLAHVVLFLTFPNLLGTKGLVAAAAAAAVVVVIADHYLHCPSAEAYSPSRFIQINT
jgi:hypothetical protein